MGTGNAAVKQWMSNRNRFADLYNGFVFGGEQVVLPEELEPVESESDILLTDKDGKMKEVQRHRDIVMRWKKGTLLTMLACENQAKVHYAMPVRNMLYDSMAYVEQMRQLWEVHKEEVMTNEEFLSKFRKEDKLYPVVTIVLYYDEKKWDGSTELYEMFAEEVSEKADILKNYVANYRINLIDVGHLEKLKVFRTDLQEIFGMLQYRGQKAELMQYMSENGDYFHHVDEDTYYAIREFLHSDRIWKREVKMKNGEGNLDMCKALEDLYNDGKIDGEREHLLKLIRTKLEKGKTVEEIADALEESVETITKLIEELNRQ